MILETHAYVALPENSELRFYKNVFMNVGMLLVQLEPLDVISVTLIPMKIIVWPVVLDGFITDFLVSVKQLLSLMFVQYQLVNQWVISLMEQNALVIFIINIVDYFSLQFQL